MTKTFTAAAILKLVARGRVALDEPVERWLPGLVPNGERITIRELLDQHEQINRMLHRAAGQHTLRASPIRDDADLDPAAAG